MRVLFNHARAHPGLSDFLFADVPLNRALEGVAAEFELSRGQLIADLFERFHISLFSLNR